jgi:acyl phosphate:glycerol-3-phosphate acyltransferase
LIYRGLIVSALVGYFLGCFQTAYLVGKIVKNIDIRNHGSNNAGASNVTIVMGIKYGIFTAFMDIIKAILAVTFIKGTFPNHVELLFITGAFVVIGHVFPFYISFKGGKGAASLIGMVLAIDFKIAIIAILTIIIVCIIIDYLAIGSIAMFATLPISTYLLNYSILCVCIGVLLALLSLYKHQINIRRIIRKEEVGLRKIVRKRILKENSGRESSF